MAKARRVAGSNGEAYDDSDSITQDGDSNLVQRVLIRQSPYFDAFCVHIPVRLVIDSDATGNMMKASCANKLGVSITVRSSSRCIIQQNE